MADSKAAGLEKLQNKVSPRSFTCYAQCSVHVHAGSSLLAQIAPGSYGAPSEGGQPDPGQQPASKKGRQDAPAGSQPNPFATLLQFTFDLAGALAPPFSAAILPGGAH